MAWNTEDTRRRIKQAATTEFARHGLHGTSIERIARLAGVNKERVYNYFGGKKELFAAVLHDEMLTVAQAVPITSSSVDDIGEYAGRVYDYHLDHPELIRLLRWEALSLDDVVAEENRRKRYEEKTAAVAAGQDAGTITSQISAEHLTLFILSIAGWWATVPQVARMLCGPPTEQEHQRRRAAVVEAAKRMATVTPTEVMDASR